MFISKFHSQGTSTSSVSVGNPVIYSVAPYGFLSFNRSHYVFSLHCLFKDSLAQVKVLLAHKSLQYIPFKSTVS